ncbi:hypothetical protein ACN2C7_09675 [Caulobacter sp. ErkDOM-E]|uniref:hypothetical protein n=1 Tax=Caulobacter sp. ErkDOM-E TaxID=3402778 RepID=UPI003AF5D5F1
MTGTVGSWYVRRTAEAAVFAVVVSIDSWPNDDSLASTLRFVAVSMATYGLALLYLPLSGLIWLFAWRGATHNKALTDSILFFVHGWVAISILYNGPWLIARPLDLENSLIVGWLAVGGLHLTLLALTVCGARRRRI